MALSETRYGAGVYSISNRHAGTNIEYLLDNQRYTLYADTMITVIVENNLLVNTNLQVNKVANNKDSIIGNVALFTG